MNRRSATISFILHEALKIQDETAIAGYEEMTDDFTGADSGRSRKDCP